MNKLYLVLEYMRRGDLMHVLKGDQSKNTCQPLGDLEVWRIFRLVARGVMYLHQQVRRSLPSPLCSLEPKLARSPASRARCQAERSRRC